jgi:hypothetical protein
MNFISQLTQSGVVTQIVKNQNINSSQEIGPYFLQFKKERMGYPPKTMDMDAKRKGEWKERMVRP